MSVMEELQAGLTRNAPGSEAATLRVAAMLEDLPDEARILDIGCGSGPQTVALAKAFEHARITAVDVDELMLGALSKRAAEANVAGRITPVAASMHALPFADDSFDAIWSEGAIFIVGFANGLRKWRPLVRAGGYVVVSECTWLTVAPSPQAQEFWDEAYPSMQRLEQNIATAHDAGYEVLGTYVLPPEAWVKEYYAELEPRIAPLLGRQEKGSRAWRQIDRVRREIETFRAFGQQYGYVFYVLRR